MDKLDQNIRESYEQVDFEFSEQAWSDFKSDWDKGVTPKRVSWLKKVYPFAAGIVLGGLLVWLLMKNGNSRVQENVALTTGDKVLESAQSDGDPNIAFNAPPSTHQSSEVSTTSNADKDQLDFKANMQFERANGNQLNQFYFELIKRELNRLRHSWNINPYGESYGVVPDLSINHGVPIDKEEEQNVSRQDRSISLLEGNHERLKPSYQLWKYRAYVPVDPPKSSNRLYYGRYSTGVISASRADGQVNVDPPTLQLSGGYEMEYGDWLLRGAIGFKNSDERRLSKSSIQINARSASVNNFSLETASMQYAIGELLLGRRIKNYGLYVGWQPSYIISARGTITQNQADNLSQSNTTNVRTDGINSFQYDWVGVIEGPINNGLRWHLRLNLPMLSASKDSYNYNSLQIEKDQFMLGIGVTNYFK